MMDTNKTNIDPLSNSLQESDHLTEFIGAFAEEIDDNQSCIDALNVRLSAAQFKIQQLDRAKAKAQTGEHILANQVFKMSRQIKELQEELQRKHFDEKLPTSDDMTIARKYLTANQIDVLLNQQKADPKWTSDEMAKAFSLRLFSVNSYTMLRTRLNYPLPDATTIDRWTNEMCMRHGTLIDVIKAMDMVAVSLTEIERLTVLLVDSMRLEGIQVSVVMARGLIGNWRQIVDIDFDCVPSAQRLNDIIVELHTANFNVVALVYNAQIMRQLNISSKKPYIRHPCSNDNIFMFPNSTQLIMQLSNESLNSTFVVEGENPAVILREPLTKLLEACATNETKIYAQLIEQIFNADVETIIRSDKLAGKQYIDWIRYIGNYFEIMNSSYNSDENSVYGRHLSKQHEMLTEFAKNISEMRCIDQQETDGLQPFQLDILIGIESLQQLYVKLSSKYTTAFNCIFGAKLNMDSLKRFFVDLQRIPDTHYHPSPKIRVLQRIKCVAYGIAPVVPLNGDPLREHFMLENSIVSETMPVLHV